MNDLVKSYVKQIQAAADDLEATLQCARKHTDKQSEAHESLLQQNWRRGKELAALKDTIEDYGPLQEENRRLAEARAQLREHLEKLLAYTKALTAEFRQ